MFSPGFVLHGANNYGVVKTETVFGFGPDKNFYQNGVNASEPLEMFFGDGNIGRSFKDTNKSSQKKFKKSVMRNTSNEKSERRNRKKHSKHKVKKCIYKLLKGKGKRLKFLKKRFLLPLLIGIVAAKSLLIPLALKALAFVSFKGLLIGFVSATMLSLKGILNHSYGYHHRRDDGSQQIENIYVPSKSSKGYQRNDLIPLPRHKFKSNNRHEQVSKSHIKI